MFKEDTIKIFVKSSRTYCGEFFFILDLSKTDYYFVKFQFTRIYGLCIYIYLNFELYSIDTLILLIVLCIQGSIGYVYITF